MLGPWGPDLLGRAYRAFNWKEDTDYLQQRRTTLLTYFETGLTLFAKPGGAGLILDVPAEQLQFWNVPLSLPREV